MVALGVDEPIDFVLLAVGPGAAAAGEQRRGRRVDGDGEHVAGLGEVGDEAAVHGEVDEHPDVEHEHGEEHDEEALVGDRAAARGVLLRADGRVEILRCRRCEWVWKITLFGRTGLLLVDEFFRSNAKTVFDRRWGKGKSHSHKKARTGHSAWI